jgi:hypothetical protein
LLTRATLAELRAARERAERDFLTALDQVDQLEAIRHELHQLAASLPNAQSDLDRKFLEVDDKLRVARSRLEKSQERQQQLEELQVESVVFDFHPIDGVRIPLSWKLTTKQQRQIDRTWAQLASGSYDHNPLQIVDKYFQRHEPSGALHHIATQRQP